MNEHTQDAVLSACQGIREDLARLVAGHDTLLKVELTALRQQVTAASVLLRGELTRNHSDGFYDGIRCALLALHHITGDLP